MDSGSHLSFQHLDSDSCPQHNCNIIMVWKQKPVVLQRAPLCTRLYGTCVSLRLSKNGRLQVEGIDWYFWLSLSPGVCVCVCLYARARGPACPCLHKWHKPGKPVCQTHALWQGRASLKAAGSHHINSPKNVLIQSSLYFMLPRAIEKSYCR